MANDYHFYKVYPDGTVEAQHNNTLSQARKAGLLGSVTTALGCWKDDFLDNIWKPKKLILETEANPRILLEPDEDYVPRIVQLMWGVRTRWDGVQFPSNDFGTAIHAELERWNIDHSYEFAPEWAMYCRQWTTLYQANIAETVAAELKVGCLKRHIAGTIDLLARGHDGLISLWDFKVRGAFKNGKGFTANKDCQQLAIEAAIIADQMGLDYLPGCNSIIIDCESGEYHHHKWTPYRVEKHLREAEAIVNAFNVVNGFTEGKDL